MNRTKRKTVDTAIKMLQANIPIEEVADMTGLTKEEIEKYKKDVTVKVRGKNDVFNFDYEDDYIHFK